MPGTIVNWEDVAPERRDVGEHARTWRTIDPRPGRRRSASRSTRADASSPVHSHRRRGGALLRARRLGPRSGRTGRPHAIAAGRCHLRARRRPRPHADRRRRRARRAPPSGRTSRPPLVRLPHARDAAPRQPSGSTPPGPRPARGRGRRGAPDRPGAQPAARERRRDRPEAAVLDELAASASSAPPSTTSGTRDRLGAHRPPPRRRRRRPAGACPPHLHAVEHESSSPSTARRRLRALRQRTARSPRSTRCAPGDVVRRPFGHPRRRPRAALRRRGVSPTSPTGCAPARTTSSSIPRSLQGLPGHPCSCASSWPTTTGTASVTSALLDRDLIVVTGKGGVGKSTVAAALGLAAAGAGCARSWSRWPRATMSRACWAATGGVR